MIDFKFAYLVGNAFLLSIWIVLFVFRKNLRKEMFLMSIIAAPLGPLSELFYLKDYWHPQYFNGWEIGIEDFLFAFAIAGIASVIYEAVFPRKYSKKHSPKHLSYLVVLIFGILWMILLNKIIGLNSIYVSSTGFIIIGVSFLFLRKDLLKDAILSGLLLGLIMLIFYPIFISIFPGIIQKWWLLKNISGILVLGTPIEELLWAFSWGFLAGPAYEFSLGYKFKK